ncbi:MAG: hypothetical protein EOO88_24260 [Pedobacter sp.]|nr:MAG: hypothetical protein EOO88_24260 [Pedobacter sp.]
MRRNLCVLRCSRTGTMMLTAILWSLLAGAQVFLSPQATSYTGLGAYSSNFRDLLSAADNPTALVSAPGMAAGVFGERRFMLAEMQHFAIAGRFSGKNAGVGVQVRYSGYSEYNETMAGLGYARDLGKIRIGAQVNYHHLSARGYGTAATYSADLAFTWELTDQVSAGIQVVNLVPVFFGPDKSEKLSSVYRLGTGYEISGKCYLAGEVSKETDKTVNVQLVVQYQFIQQLFLRLGLNTDVGRPFAGFGWAWKNLRLDVTGSYHPQLGFSPGMLFIFSNNPKN